MAVNFSAVKQGSFVGRAARAALDLVPKRAVVPILQGELKGLRWVVGSSIHGCWLGTSDLVNQRIFRQHIKPGSVVYDIGANVGYYTLLASKLAGPTGKVYSFEPLPRNLELLRRHVAINVNAGGRCTGNVTVIDAAVSDAAGTATFMPDVSPDRAHLVGMGDRHVDREKEASGQVKGIDVRLVCLDDLTGAASNAIPAPNMMKIDVEGAEASVLKGAAKTIAKTRPVILMATHGPEVHKACCDMLRGWGYELTPLGCDDISRAEELVAVPKGR